MAHITVLREEEDPLQVIPITKCGGCEAGCSLVKSFFHCPICPVSKFKPKPSLEVVKSHLINHFISKKVSAHVGGYKFSGCEKPCTLDGIGVHFHCPHCPVTLKKKDLAKHVSTHGSQATVHESPRVPSMHPDPKMYDEVTRLNDSVQSLNLSSMRNGTIQSLNLFSRLNDSSLSLNLPSNQVCNASLKREEVLGLSSRETLESLINEYKQSNDVSHFREIFKCFSMAKNEAVKLSWIKSMTECAHLLDRKSDKIVLDFMRIPLFTSSKLAEATKDFIRTLIGIHNYYAYHILKRLFHHLIPVIEEGKEEELRAQAGLLKEEEEATYERVISTIVLVNSDIPMTQDNLLALARKSMPYFQNHVHIHAVYAHNLLLLASYLPQLRVAVLEVIITNMITIDVHTPRAELVEDTDDDDEEEIDSSDEELFDMEMEESLGKQVTGPCSSGGDDTPLDVYRVPEPLSHKAGNTLDVLMSIMLQYVHDVCHGCLKPKMPPHLQRTCTEVNSEPACRPGYLGATEFDPKRMGKCECGGKYQDVDAVKRLYNDLKEIFANIILRTHASSHVQFLLFYVLSIRPGLLSFFADYLINKKFKDPNCSLYIRKNAMAYIGSLLARGKHVTILDVHACLESIRDWGNEYLDNVEQTHDKNFEDLGLHGAFYSACQTLFYVFTFRYHQYSENKKTLSLARSLNFDRFIHSKLNPLNVCSPTIVGNFALVAQHSQIAYCYTVIEENKRHEIPAARVDTGLEAVTVLEMYFPFDPYLLSRSKMYIENHYREFEGLPEDLAEEDGMDGSMDVDEIPKMFTSPRSYDMHGISPGFVRFSKFTEESVYS